MRTLLFALALVAPFGYFVPDFIVRSERLDEFRECHRLRPGETPADFGAMLSRDYNYGRPVSVETSGCPEGHARLDGY